MTSAAIPPLVEVRGVTKRYAGNAPVLEDTSVALPPGSLTALVGRSGSGKSTLLNLLGSLTEPDSGTVCFRGQDLRRLDDSGRARYRREHVGFVFQHFFLRPGRSALDNVVAPAAFLGKPLSAARAAAHEALEAVGLGPHVHSRASTLSGGQCQRVAIARALINSPSLLLADEPTGNLDTQTSLEVFELLMRLNQERAMTILLVTHDPLVDRFGIPKLTIENRRVVVCDHPV